MLPDCNSRCEAGMSEAPKSGKSTVPFNCGEAVSLRTKAWELRSAAWLPTHSWVERCASAGGGQRAAARSNDVRTCRTLGILPSSSHADLSPTIQDTEAAR